MMTETVSFRPLTASDYAHFDALFESLKTRLAALLPPSADIQHIGATAVPGLLTKGDLDLVIRVPAADFFTAKAALDPHYAPNTGSDSNAEFTSYTGNADGTDLGLQLLVIGSLYDDFHILRDRLLDDSQAVSSLNDLKRAFDNKNMDDYRAAKSALIQKLLGETK